jgi:hypothetical protein
MDNPSASPPGKALPLEKLYLNGPAGLPPFKNLPILPAKSR